MDDEDFKQKLKNFNTTHQEHLEGIGKIIFFSDKFSKSLKDANESYQKIIVSRKKLHQNFLSWATSEINKKKSKNAILQFLHLQKAEVTKKIISANIQHDGYTRKDYEEIISKIIDPLIKIYNDFPSTNEEKKGSVSNSPENNHNIIIEYKKTSEIIPIQTKNKDVEDISPNQQAEGMVPKELPEGFEQISCDATKEEILFYFGILSKEKNEINNKPYLPEPDVIRLVEKNYKAFGCTPTGEYFILNLAENQKNRLRYFMHQFNLWYNKYGEKEKYARFLKHNFYVFKNDDIQTILKNMCETQKPKDENHILTKKYINRIQKGK